MLYESRRFVPNLQKQTLQSELLGKPFRLRISMHALRSVEARGGLDGFLLRAKAENLSLKARRLKRDIKRAQAAAEAA